METRAAIYARQSVSNTEGIERQITRCRALAEARGYNVVTTYAENDTSATSGVRPEWLKLIDDFNNDRVDVVVAVNLDRLLRTLADLTPLLEVGAIVLTVEGDLDLTTSDGEFRASLLASLARFEVARKSERQIRANETRHAQGKALPGRRRYGYKQGNREVEPDEAAIVRRMFDECATGSTLRSIAMRLNAEGKVPTTGKAAKWRPIRVRETLRNAAYAGYSVRHGVRVLSDEIPAIVPQETFEAVQVILDDDKRKTSPGPKRKHLLSGLLYCGTCGAKMRHMNGYLCSDVSGSKGHPFITKNLVEPYVLKEVARTLCAGAGDVLEASDAQKLAPLISEREKLSQRVAQTLADRDDDLIPAEMARQRLLALRTQRRALDEKIDEVRLATSDGATLESLAMSLLTDKDGGVIPMTKFDEAVEKVETALRDLDLDAQRTIIEALLHIEVFAGRDITKRVLFQHKRSPWLDADAIDKADV